MFGDIFTKREWGVGLAGIYYHDKTGNCRVDLKNKSKLQ